MTTRKFAALLNDGEGRFWTFHPGDKLVPGGPILTVTAGDGALDKVYEIGNRMGRDLDGTEWPSDVRSLSAGDVLLDVTECPWTGYAIDPVGFKPVTPDDVIGGLFGKSNPRGSFYADLPPTG